MVLFVTRPYCVCVTRLWCDFIVNWLAISISSNNCFPLHYSDNRPHRWDPHAFHPWLIDCWSNQHVVKKTDSSLLASVCRKVLREQGREIIKLFSCSNQLSMKFEMFTSIKKYQDNQLFSGSDKPRTLFFLLINVKMPTIAGILTSISKKYFMFIWVENGKSRGQIKPD